MKLWRKQAMVAGKGTGRGIRRQAMMEEVFFQKLPKTYPLLNRVLERAGVPTLSTPFLGQVNRAAEKESADEAQ